MPQKDNIQLPPSIRSILRISGIPNATLSETIISQQLATCSQLASRFLGDSTHRLHSYLEAARTRRFTRQIYRLLPARTEAYKKSIIPFLDRFFVRSKLGYCWAAHQLILLNMYFYTSLSIHTPCLLNILTSALRQLNTCIYLGQLGSQFENMPQWLTSLGVSSRRRIGLGLDMRPEEKTFTASIIS